MTRRDHSVKVGVPKAEDDQPRLARVGVIAAVGFGIGILWPWLAGVQLVPDAPSANSKGGQAPTASATPSAKPPPPPAEAAPSRSKEQSVKVGDAIVASCRDDRGRKIDECDKIDFGQLAKARIQALAGCPAAKGAAEILSIGFDLDFEKNTVRDILSGKSTTFSKKKTKALIDCARKEFASVKLDDIDHEYARYAIYYFAEFIPPGTVSAKKGTQTGDQPLTEASGLATVTWDVALVRETPEEGKVRTRLRYGTRVVVTARRGKWYLVKYDSKGSKGWVHKNAIGL